MATFDANLFEIGSVKYTTPTPDVPQHFGAFLFKTAATSGGAPATVTYTMRGFDQNGAVNDYVTWTSSEVDDDASDYAGSAGPVVDIVVLNVKQ